jgi:hypothetical protein
VTNNHADKQTQQKEKNNSGQLDWDIDTNYTKPKLNSEKRTTTNSNPPAGHHTALPKPQTIRTSGRVVVTTRGVVADDNPHRTSLLPSKGSRRRSLQAV